MEATTTTVDEIAAAGAHYLEIVAPSNCVIEQIIALEDSVRSDDGYIYDDKWDDMVDGGLLTLYAEASVAEVEFLEALATYNWPDVVEEDVQSLIEEVSATASWSRSVSETQSFDEWVTIWEAPPEFVSAAVVRAKLHLESNIGSDTPDCVST
jgi:hypothetical protein